MSGLGNRMSAGPGPGRLHIQYLTEQNCPGYLYQPESGAEPVKKGGVFFRTGTNPGGGFVQYCPRWSRKACGDTPPGEGPVVDQRCWLVSADAWVVWA